MAKRRRKIENLRKPTHNTETKKQNKNKHNTDRRMRKKVATKVTAGVRLFL